MLALDNISWYTKVEFVERLISSHRNSKLRRAIGQVLSEHNFLIKRNVNLVAFVDEGNFRCRCFHITTCIWHVLWTTLASPTLFHKALGIATISINKVTVIALDHSEIESVTTDFDASWVHRIWMLSHTWLIFASEACIFVEFVSRSAGYTVKARHSLACETRGVAIIASKGRLNSTILTFHALEESAFTVI